MEGELLVSGSDDCSIRVWSLASGQCVENVTAKGRPVLAVALKVRVWVRVRVWVWVRVSH